MMFKKYISKISNTIGTVNYLSQKTKEKHRRASHYHNQHFFDDGYDVVDVDPSSVHQMDIDVSANGSRKSSMIDDDLRESEQIILSAAVAKLRNMLFFYPLVFPLTFTPFYALFSVPRHKPIINILSISFQFRNFRFIVNRINS